MIKNFYRWYDRRRKRKTPATQNSNWASVRTERLVSNRTKIEVGSWNVEEKGSPEEIDKILTESMKEQLDVVCLQRASLPAPNTETNNYKWLCSGTSGSTILVNKSSDLVSTSFERFSDYICMTELTGKNDVKINVLSCYIPPETDYTSEEVWTKLKEVIGSISHTLFILAGDFNAQLGKEEMQFSPQCQKRLYHELSNENGKKLSALIRKCHIVLYLSHKKDSTEVFTFNDEKLKSQQSCILLPFARQSFVSDDNMVWIPEYNHALLRYRVICKRNEIHNYQWESESTTNEPTTVVASWNIQSATPAKIDLVLNEFKLPIVCIQELFLTSDEDIQTENYTWLCTKKLWAKNVGILIKKSPNIVLSKFEPLSEYLCIASILFYGKPLTVVSLHMPAVSDSQHEQVVNQTKEQISSIPEESFIMLGGDFSSVSKEGRVSNSDEFVLNLAKENKLGLAYQEDLKGKSTHFTQITESGKCRANYVLLSESALKSLTVYLHFRWVPFFDCGIICLAARKKLEVKKKFNFDSIKVLDKPAIEVHMITENGATTKTVTYKYICRELDSQEDTAGFVSEEDKKKFKDTPPSAEEFGRLFKDFVIVQGASRKSNLIVTPLGILTKSLIDSRVGNFVVESITETQGKSRSICRIKWNEILLAEEIGELQERHQHLLKKATQSLIAKLSQTCHTVKAKKSFFNKGFLPVLMGEPELAGILKTVDKSSFSTIEDLYKMIDDFIAEDTDNELVFGKGFSTEELLNIAEYAYKKTGLADFRFFRSEYNDSSPDNLAVFRKRTAQYLRDMLIKEPKNFKYFLIPPCGLGVDYIEFNQKVISAVSKEESELWLKFTKKENERQGEVDKKRLPRLRQPKDKASLNQKKPQRSVLNQKNLQRSVPNQKNSQQNVRSQPLGRPSSTRMMNRQQIVRSQNLGRANLNKNPRLNGRAQLTGRTSTLTRRPRPQQNQISGRVNSVGRSPRSRFNQRPEHTGGRKRDYSMMDLNQAGPYESDQYFERSRREQDYTTDSYHNDSYQSNRYLDTSRRESDYDWDRNVSFDSNQFYESGLSSKRQKFDDMSDSISFRLEMPDWLNIRPLLIVWPITVRSQLEERPEQVLSDNFNVEYKTKTMNNQSVTAVFVSLTHYNGSGRMYCIAKGSNTRNAARSALELLVKHCTVIKPNPTFLCNGLTPSFIRYKIPCQLYPRTYLILDRSGTGSLTPRVIEDLVNRLINSCEEELYFDRDSYSLDEKLAVIEGVPKLAPNQLMTRHFGDSSKLIDRYVCVYKLKPKHQILQEVLKMKGEHPRYILTINRLPPDMGSVF